MRYIHLVFAAAVSTAVGFCAGFSYRGARLPAAAQLEDYALTNLLENVSYANYLAQGNQANHRELLNVVIEGHLTKVRESQGANDSPEFQAAKIRTLNAVANLWAQEPPFTSDEWRQNEANQAWWAEWRVRREKNLELLRWAQDQCAKDPALKCRKPGDAK
jgi:hypothetical protein